MYRCKVDLRVSCHNDLTSQAGTLCDQLSPHFCLAFDAASERGASCWLTTLPIAENGFASSKGEFHDALCLRFGWQPVNLPQTCVCGRSFCVEHTFNCPCGGFPSICHNEVRDLTASLLSEVCSDFGVEPALQPLDGEALQFTTAKAIPSGNPVSGPRPHHL